MPSAAYSAVASLTAFSLFVSTAAPAWAAQPPLTRSEYDACQTQDEAAFRTAIEGITVAALERGMKDFDYRGAVGAEWRRNNLSEIVDREVDKAIEAVRSETSFGTLLQSLADGKKAEALAKAVAERVYQSDAVKTAIEQLAVGVGKSVADRIEIASQDAARPALRCLQSYLGPRYGVTVARVVATDAGSDFGITPEAGDAEVSTADLLKRNTSGVAGVAILLVRRQLARMASRVGQRLVGSVLSRLVSTVAGGIGVVLVLKDLWDLRQGVMPIIAEEMKSASTKEKVQDELARALEEIISQHVKEIGAKAAEHVVEVWQQFRQAHAKALDLAAGNERFKAFLDGLPPDKLPRLDEVVSLTLASEGESGLMARLDNGTLSTAVKTLPDAGLAIAREQSLADALAWSALAGNKLDKIVELDLYKRVKPEDLTREGLTRLLAMDDRLAMLRLAGLARSARDVLFELDSAKLEALTRNLSEDELQSLAAYVTGLDSGARKLLLETVSRNPAVMRTIAPDRVRSAIVASRDQTAAMTMMLRQSSLFDVRAIEADIALVKDGRVSPWLLWERHPAAIFAGLILVLIILLVFRRLFTPRRSARQVAAGVE